MNWHYLDPEGFDPKIFGLKKIYAVKAARWHGEYDVRTFRLNGWKVFAYIIELHPVTGKLLKESEWWVFVAKGE